jgi:hypothetical protein
LLNKKNLKAKNNNLFIALKAQIGIHESRYPSMVNILVTSSKIVKLLSAWQYIMLTSLVFTSGCDTAVRSN